MFVFFVLSITGPDTLRDCFMFVSRHLDGKSKLLVVPEDLLGFVCLLVCLFGGLFVCFVLFCFLFQRPFRVSCL